jgi:hypothetical protein
MQHQSAPSYTRKERVEWTALQYLYQSKENPILFSTMQNLVNAFCNSPTLRDKTSMVKVRLEIFADSVDRRQSRSVNNDTFAKDFARAKKIIVFLKSLNLVQGTLQALSVRAVNFFDRSDPSSNLFVDFRFSRVNEAAILYLRLQKATAEASFPMRAVALPEGITKI